MIELNKVYHQDCLEGMRDIPDKSIDMILCDLPYGTTACKWDVIIPFEPLWEQYERIIKDNGAIVLTASQPFTSLLVMSNIKLFKYELIWDKGSVSSPGIAKFRPMPLHESILVFGKERLCYNPIMREGFKTYRRVAREYSRKESEHKYGYKIQPVRVDSDKRYPVSIIGIQNLKGNTTIQFHPTQKPIALFEYLIKTYTNEGETVLDNCMGSGTTAIACINSNRNYIGFEKEEKYYNIIQERIKKHTQQQKLFAA